MKAIRIHGPKDARYEEVPTPKPGPDDVLIKVKAVAICATDVAVSYTKGDVAAQVAAATDGEMVDVVIEAVGRKSVWPMIASIVAPGARVAMTGLFAGELCDVDFDPLVVQEVSIFGCLGAPGMWPECISLHRKGLVRAERIITHRLPLSEFTEAIEISRGRRAGAIKVLLNP